MNQRETIRPAAINEHRRRLFGEAGRPLAMVCECGDPACHETIILEVVEYDTRRPAPIMHPAHAKRETPPDR